MQRTNTVATKMDKKTGDKILDKIERIEAHLAEMNVTLAKQSVILAEHTKRSTELEEEFKPVRAHVIRVNFIGTLVAGVGVVVSLIYTILRLFSVL